MRPVSSIGRPGEGGGVVVDTQVAEFNHDDNDS